MTSPFANPRRPTPCPDRSPYPSPGPFLVSLKNTFDVVRDDLDLLHRAVEGDDGVLHVLGPQVELDEVAQQVRVDHLELAREHAARVDVARVRLDAVRRHQRIFPPRTCQREPANTSLCAHAQRTTR